jgi:serine/threonine protein kinase
VDVWSVGATIWEIIEGSPPFLDIEDPSDFGDRWPPLQRANEFSVSLHQFLRLCSEMDDWRPHPDELLDVGNSFFTTLPFLHAHDSTLLIRHHLSRARVRDVKSLPYLQKLDYWRMDLAIDNTFHIPLDDFTRILFSFPYTLSFFFFRVKYIMLICYWVSWMGQYTWLNVLESHSV